MVQAAETMELRPETLLAYATHIGQAETEVEQMLRGDQQFLWSDACAERIAQLRKGTTVVESCSGTRAIQVPDGLIHDWIGATCVPGTTMENALALVQNYDNHRNIYQPEVIGSRLVSRQGDDFQIYLRLRKKKIITVILDTDHDVHYFFVGCHTLVLPHPHYADFRSRRRGQAYGERTAAGHGIRISVAAQFLLAICRERQLRLHRMPGNLADPRCAEGTGMDH